MMRAQSGIGFSGGGIGLKSSGVLAQSAVAASVTGTLTETVLATIAIPAGAMGVNGAIRVTALWSYTNSADTKTVRVRLGGTTTFSRGLTTTATEYLQAQIANRGVLNSQISTITPGPADSAAAFVLTVVDMSVAQNITLTGTIGANAGANTITLEGYTVEILNP